MVATITTPRLMAVGGGALAELPGMLKRFGLARPLVVTDPYIRGCGILERATALLDQHKSAGRSLPTRFRIRPRRWSRPGRECSPRVGSTASSRSAAAARSIPRRE